LKLEKRSAEVQQTPQTAETTCTRKERSHILVYILILFIAAFLLMALSFLSHQRSNEQVLGQLRTNVSNLEMLQDALEENTRLQDQIDIQKSRLEELEKALEASQGDQKQLTGKISSMESTLAEQQKNLDAHKQTIAAMDALVQLQQLLIAGDSTTCRKLITDMETAGLDKLLPTVATAPGGVSPYQMFQAVKLLTAIPTEG